MLKLNLRSYPVLKIYRLFCFNGLQPSLLYSINPQRREQILILCTMSIRRELKVLIKQVLLVQSNYFTFVFKSLWKKCLTIEVIGSTL